MISPFISSNPVIALDYCLYINKTIYKSKDRINNPFWQQTWTEFFNSKYELSNFFLFLETSTGQKWLQSEPGQAYLAWQSG